MTKSSKHNQVVKLRLAGLTIDPAIQPRAAVDPAVVAEYAEAMKARAKFPAIIVFKDAGTFYVADGFQRLEAARLAGLSSILVDVREGTRRDAMLFACGCNTTHGARRTDADKKAVVLRLLNDPQWATMSDREIGRRCSVGGPFVAKLRGESICNRMQMRKVTRGGKTYTMDTAKIGAKAAPATNPPPLKVDADPDLQFGLNRITKRGMCSCGERNCKHTKPLPKRASFSRDKINFGEGCSEGARVAEVTKMILDAAGFERASVGMTRGVVTLGLDVAEKIAELVGGNR